MGVLRLKIKRRHFDAILDGTKTVEYRRVDARYSRRLQDGQVSMLRLDAGYSKTSPSLIVGVKRIVKIQTPPTLKGFGKEVYAIHLGTSDRV